MPPRHLIVPSGSTQNHHTTVHDLQSSPVELLAGNLSAGVDARQILFSPSWALNKDVKAYLHSQGIILTTLTSPYLHLDTDHLAESISMYQGGESLWQSFSYAAYNVEHETVDVGK